MMTWKGGSDTSAEVERRFVVVEDEVVGAAKGHEDIHDVLLLDDG